MKITADTLTDAQIHVVRKAMLGVPRKNSYRRAILADCGGALNGSGHAASPWPARTTR